MHANGYNADQERELEVVYRGCAVALNRYMTEAHNTCSLAGRRSDGERISLKAIAEQERREAKAQEKYRAMRKQLLATLMNLAVAEQPKKAAAGE